MKLRDIVNQLQVILPTRTDLVSETVGVTSMTLAGTTVTVVTDTDHGFSVGDPVLVSGAEAPVEIDTLSQIDGVASAVTLTNHDITEDFPERENVRIEGADQAEYNGEHKVLSANSRLRTTFEIDDGAPATATGAQILLFDGAERGYNGDFLVDTVPNTTTFTYEIDAGVAANLFATAFGTIAIHVEIRITGTVTAERFVDELYTAQPDNEDIWACAVLGDSTASSNRSTDNDATDIQATMSELRQKVVDQFAVYVVVPAKDELAAVDARDLVEDIKSPIYKSVMGVKFPTFLCIEQQYGVTLASHGFFSYNGAYYVHEFVFESVSQIGNADLVDPDKNVAFRDVCLRFQNKFNEDIINSDVDLDDEPEQ